MTEAFIWMVMLGVNGLVVVVRFSEHKPGILFRECYCFSSACSPHILECVLNYSSLLGVYVLM